MRRDLRPTLRWGGICGGGAAALVIVHEILATFVLDGSIAVTILAGVGFFLVYLVLFLAAGALAARESGSVRAGVLAGLFAGGISGGTSALASIFDLARQPLQDASPPGSAPSSAHFYAVLALIALIVLLVTQLIFAGFGAGFGALGGIAGRPTVSVTQPDVPTIPLAAESAPSHEQA